MIFWGLKMKVIIVGASHGGHEAAFELLDRYSDIDVTVYEQSDFISFMSCGMQLFLEGQTTKRDNVRNFTPTDLEMRGGKVQMNSQVIKIDPSVHQITVKNLITEGISTDSYDRLILSTGVTPALIPIKGVDLENIYLMRGRDWAIKLNEKLHDKTVKNVVIVGAGYIGIEASEIFAKAGKQVTVVDKITQPLGNYLDEPLSNEVKNELINSGVSLHLGHGVSEFRGDSGVTQVITDDGQHFAADLCIIAAGVRPNTDWLAGTVDLDSRGWIATDPFLRTSQPDIFAIGDAILPAYASVGKQAPIALASTARREARYVAENIYQMSQPERPFSGVNGTSALRVFGLKLANTGLNDYSAKNLSIKTESSLYVGSLLPSFVKLDNPRVMIKLTYNPINHVILGGQILSQANVVEIVNTIALAIKGKMTLSDLAEADFFFQPSFDKQWSILNLAAQHALGEYMTIA